MIIGEDLQITNRLLNKLSYVGLPVKIVAEDSLRAIAALDQRSSRLRSASKLVKIGGTNLLPSAVANVKHFHPFLFLNNAKDHAIDVGLWPYSR